MPFEYLARLLSPGKSRMDTIEERLSKIETSISKLSMVQRGPSKTGETAKRRGSRQRSSERARSVYTSEGWHVPRDEDEIRMREFGDDWRIEFQCPSCGSVSSEGINHWHVRRQDGHTKYGMYLDCKNCGWQSDLINIRAFR